MGADLPCFPLQLPFIAMRIPVVNQSGIRLPEIIFISAMLGTLFLCSTGSVASEPRITDAILGQDRIDKTNGYEVVKPTAVFRPDSPKIVCVFKIEGASLGTTVKSIWIAEDVGKKAPPNYKIAEKTLPLPFINAGSFTLSKPNNGWPVGSYRLEIYIGSTLAKTLKFTVKAS